MDVFSLSTSIMKQMLFISDVNTHLHLTFSRLHELRVIHLDDVSHIIITIRTSEADFIPLIDMYKFTREKWK